MKTVNVILFALIGLSGAALLIGAMLFDIESINNRIGMAAMSIPFLTVTYLAWTDYLDDLVIEEFEEELNNPNRI